LVYEVQELEGKGWVGMETPRQVKHKVREDGGNRYGGDDEDFGSWLLEPSGRIGRDISYCGYLRTGNQSVDQV
jgi:hypothetical protein